MEPDIREKEFLYTAYNLDGVDIPMKDHEETTKEVADEVRNLLIKVSKSSDDVENLKGSIVDLEQNISNSEKRMKEIGDRVYDIECKIDDDFENIYHLLESSTRNLDSIIDSIKYLDTSIADTFYPVIEYILTKNLNDKKEENQKTLSKMQSISYVTESALEKNRNLVNSFNKEIENLRKNNSEQSKIIEQQFLLIESLKSMIPPYLQRNRADFEL